MKLKKLFAAILMVITILPAFAQWVTNPALNTLASSGGMFTDPKIVTDETGNSIISYWELVPPNSYCHLRMQRVDGNGYPLWGPQGILLTYQDTNQTFTTVYDLGIDKEGNAIVVIEDGRHSIDGDIYAYKISASGNFMWGPDGLQLSSGTGYDLMPRILVTPANSVIFAWDTEDSNGIRMQCVSAGGSLLWGNNGIWLHAQPSAPLGFYSYPNLVGCDEASFYLVWQEANAVFLSSQQNLVMNRFDMNGQKIWPADLVIQNLGTFPVISRIHAISDHQQGCIVSWLDCRYNPFIMNAYIQKIDDAANISFVQNGKGISCNGLTSTNDILSMGDPYGNVFSAYAMDTAIYVQKTDPSGQAVWGYYGFKVIGLDSTDQYLSQLHMQQVADKFLVMFARDSMNIDVLSASMFDCNGNIFPYSGPSPVSTCQSGKIFSCLGCFSGDQLVAAWSDDRNPNESDIYVQNILPSSFIGPVGTDDVSDFEIRVWPTPAKETLNLDLSAWQEGTMNLEIISVTGQKVLEIRGISHRNITIPVSDIKPGIYQVVVRSGNKAGCRRISIL